MTPLQTFLHILESGDTGALTPELVDDLSSAYPFFTLPAAMLLRTGTVTDTHTISDIKARIALNAPDTDSLLRLIDPDGTTLAGFYPPKETPATPTTDAAIDTFLDNYGAIDPKEQQLLERLIFQPVPDYSQVLAREAGAETPAAVSEQDALLDAFLAGHQQEVEEERRAAEAPVVPPQSQHPPKPDPDSSLNESLAIMFIKKRRYDKAYEIIRQLSLNFPQKSIYFADQMRYLKKLMLNQKHFKR